MPKHEVGSTKWLGNKMKSKGLSKLQFYCQVCQKQCRDANGFKCHQTSEIHMRNMALFMDNPTQFIDQYSGEFEQGRSGTVIVGESYSQEFDEQGSSSTIHPRSLTSKVGRELHRPV